MILSFKNQFVPKINIGSKIHTIRADAKDRWKIGNKIHFAIGVRTKNYRNFKMGTCLNIQKIEFKYVMHDDKIPVVLVDGVVLTTPEVNLLARNDGFDSIEDFYEWFHCDFVGKIIHWTKYFY
ncbi:MAG: hypothetical protein H8D23_17770 [Candidatus Brocadiales bacterium]|nr:hypothetical protein [Candidatus Brocadiales bacterium]